MNVDQRQRIEQEIARAAATGLIEAALLLSAIGNGAWLAGVFIRSVSEPVSRRQHHVA